MHFGLDMLEAFAFFREEYLLEWIDTDNSNFRTFEGYVISNNEVRDYEYKIVFTKENFPLFAYYKGSTKSNIPTKDYVCAYATAFRIMWPQEVRDFLEKNFQIEKLRRFDICLDIPYPIAEVSKHFKVPTQKWSRFMWSRGNLETVYIGEKKNTQNKRQLIRIYDKIADLVQKWKQLLYSEYLMSEYVTRAEIEIRQELARNIQFHEVFDQTMLLKIFKNYFRKHTDLFDTITEGKKSLFVKREKVEYDYIQHRSYCLYRSKLLKGIAKSLLDVWICPIETLLKYGLVSERTKIGLWYSLEGFLGKIIFKRELLNSIIPKRK